MWKPHYSFQDFSPFWPMGTTYCIVIIKKPPLHNVNSLIMDPITEMGVAQSRVNFCKKYT